MLFTRAVGPEIALARPARAAGRQPRHRPRRHQWRRVYLGLSKLAHSFIPQGSWVLLWRRRRMPYDVKRAKGALAEAGYPNGFDGATSPATRSTAWRSASRC